MTTCARGRRPRSARVVRLVWPAVRVAVLTTDTTHHTYFVWQLAERGLLDSVVLETRSLSAPFETHHPFEEERDAYERETLLAGAPAGIDGYAQTASVESVDDAG